MYIAAEFEGMQMDVLYGVMGCVEFAGFGLTMARLHQEGPQVPSCIGYRVRDYRKSCAGSLEERMKALFQAAILFSVFFCGAGLLMAHAYTSGVISARALGGALAALVVVSAVGIALMVRSRSVRGAILELQNTGSKARRGRAFVILAAKVALIVLMLALMNALLHITERPVVPHLVGGGPNLLITYAIVGAIRKMKTPSQR